MNSAGVMSQMVRLHLTYDGRADGPPTITCGGGLVEFRTDDAIRSYALGLERLLAAIDDHHQLEERV
jgi:hypothetical protein